MSALSKKITKKNHRINQKEENIFTSEIQSHNLHLVTYVLPKNVDYNTSIRMAKINK